MHGEEPPMLHPSTAPDHIVTLAHPTTEGETWDEVTHQAEVLTYSFWAAKSSPSLLPPQFLYFAICASAVLQKRKDH